VGCPFWREVGSVVLSFSWASPAQPFSGLIPTGLMSILYCPYFWDSPNLEGQVPVFISPRNRVRNRNWVLLERPPVVQLLSNFSALYGTRSFITVFTRILHRCLSSAISIQSLLPHHIPMDSFLAELGPACTKILWNLVSSLLTVTSNLWMIRDKN
jgi:hypothetical protein